MVTLGSAATEERKILNMERRALKSSSWYYKGRMWLVLGKFEGKEAL